ncbi:MAG: RHS repeat-associated core domain-containing protein, partial [Phycisphaerales bacterium]|nr:RHS repeat-associated core domain-containing protein [Phycisphaerales bacterium]
YHVRHRVYDPREGRWMQNDPLGFGAGDQDLYRYCGGEYSMGYDPLGLMAWYDEAFDWVGNAGAGLGDGLSLGITRVLRNGIDAVTGAGINDAVDTTSAAYQNSVVIGASVTVSVITGGTAAAYFGAGGAVLTGTEMMAVGAFAGYSGAVTAQGVEMLQGRRGKVDFVSIAFNTMLGAVLGGLSYEVEAWLNARYGVMPRLTSEPMPANGSCGNPDKPAVTWNNGWRTADGKFASPQGLGRPGGAAEEAVWNAIEAKPGWMVVRGRVSVRGETGQLRVYDGVAISPSGRAVGLEIKSGSGTMTTAQRAFDSALNATGGQWVYGVGNYLGRTIRRAIEIRRP